MRRFTAIVIVIAVALASASCTTGPSSPSGPTLATATSTSLATAIASATASAPSPPLSGWIAHPIAEIGNTPIAALGGGADGFIAILRAGTGLTELRSSDGIAWTAVSAKGTVPNNGFLYDIGGGRWLGVGTAYPSTGSVTLASARVSAPRSGATLASSCEGPSPDAAIWESADGVTWSRVPEQASLKA